MLRRDLFRVTLGGFAAAGLVFLATAARADDQQTAPQPSTAAPPGVATTIPVASAATPAATAAPSQYDASGRPSRSAMASGGGADDESKHPPFALVTKDFKHIPGLVSLYEKDNDLLAEIGPAHFNRDFIVVMTIARGIGRGPLYGGMPAGESVWQFRRVGDQVQIVERNLRYMASHGSPEERAVGLAYTDSILFSLPIVTTTPGGGVLVNLNQVFMTDLAEIGRVLPGFMFAGNRSTWAEARGYEDNVELEVAATYASSGARDMETVADSRAVTVNIHYSLSLLPANGYRPRLADDRIGYFITVLKDYSHKTDEDRFVRYINRWDLQKADPSAEQSPPKKPIIFWIEKTVPYNFRKPIREGILEWNKAFEKAGFLNAIEVRQQPDNADWDPEDVNYNTFRWMTSSSGFAMGPSRANPLTGQLLNASVIFDADFLQTWKASYEIFTPRGIEALTGGPLDLKSYAAQKPLTTFGQSTYNQCTLLNGESRELALATSVLTARMAPALSETELNRLMMEGMKMVTMHEIGHTLGLRHNFRASAMLSLKDLNDPEKVKDIGMGASVMDYYPVNIVPSGQKQGNYYTPTIGPYDVWSIEYGYTPVPAGSPEGELPFLKKIAARSGEHQLAYLTDEDTRGIDSDPLSNRFDLGDDTVAFAKQRSQVINELWPKLVDRMVKDGDGYQHARQAFGILLGSEGMALHLASRYVGGVYVSRSHKGDAKAKEPFEVVDAKKQREALQLLEDQVFNDRPFQFPPSLYNHLAANHWEHWGSEIPLRDDLPIHEIIAMWQERMLDQLFSPLTLSRLYDSELRLPPEQDAFTTVELIHGLTNSIFAETENLKPGDYTNRKPAISSLRRNEQRVYLKHLSNLAMGETGAPQDCATVAYGELVSLHGRIEKLLGGNIKLDDYSKDHLLESSNRINKVLEARLELHEP